MRRNHRGVPFLVDLLKLQTESLDLSGELPVAELDLGGDDTVVHLVHPLEYELTATNLDDALLVQGELRLPLDCECVRCLTPFMLVVEVPEFAVHLPLKGEDAVPVVGDCVDLTPFCAKTFYSRFRSIHCASLTVAVCRSSRPAARRGQPPRRTQARRRGPR